VQQLDMDVAPETWTPPELIDRAALNGVPHHGLGRGFKAGKEEIVGLLVALERFAAADDDALNAQREARLARIAARLATLPGIATRVLSARETGRVPVLEVAIDPAAARASALELSARLQRADPPVHLSERFASGGVLIVDPQVLRPDDDAVVAEAIERALAAAR
jgi:L-seryl-tRNA(Ser) seleniumtransferase